jgi:hypothetical protein
LNELLVILRCRRIVILLFPFFVVFIRFSFFFVLLRNITSFRRQTKSGSGDVALSSVLKPLLNHDSVPAPINAFFAGLAVKFYRFSTCRAFGFFNQPCPKATKMENMAAAELLTLSDVAQTNATLEVLLLRGLNIFKSP